MLQHHHTYNQNISSSQFQVEPGIGMASTNIGQVRSNIERDPSSTLSMGNQVKGINNQSTDCERYGWNSPAHRQFRIPWGSWWHSRARCGRRQWRRRTRANPRSAPSFVETLAQLLQPWMDDSGPGPRRNRRASGGFLREMKWILRLNPSEVRPGNA